MSKSRNAGGAAPYDRRDAASGRSPFHDSSAGGKPHSGWRRAAAALGSCFRTEWRPGSALGGGGSQETSEASHLTSAASSRTYRNNGVGSPGKSLYRSKNNSEHKELWSAGMAFTLADIKRATNNFSASQKIGQGGFGTVYKGVVDGKVVAIKRGKKIMYDKHVDAEFQSEVSTLATIEHLNLVKYIGYLETEGERILVVEYVPNGTLREHLDGARGGPLDLASRLDIAVDIAHALTYLHMYADNPIIHRDIKSSNILLTDKLRAKVADFGFARMGSVDDGKTHISTQIKGTAGYMDPEYLQTYQLTVKSDVYSFGILLVEIITGRRPIESKREMKERLTYRWAMKKSMDGDSIQVLDPNLPQNPPTNLALEQILELAFKCIAPSRHARPSMRRCAEILWNVRKEYREQAHSDLLSRSSSSQRSTSQRDDSGNVTKQQL